MDDLKRTIYMEARRMIDAGERRFLCYALHSALRDITGLDLEMLEERLADLFEEFFPEFFRLHDGHYYAPSSCLALEGEFYIVRDHFLYAVWWEYGWKEPRLATLDYILNR